MLKTDIENAFKGFNTTVMLYGITGSGKTHTVFGNLGYRDENGDCENGIIYYTFQRIVQEHLNEVQMSYVEIYNEQVKDLLGTEDNLLVADNGNGEVLIPGVEMKPVDNFEEMIQYIKQGNQRRKVAKTCANAFSSRSHAILQLHLKKKIDDYYLVSKLTFLDLAGSERVDTTQNKGSSRKLISGLRLAEGSNINKSLLALGKVINKLSDGSIDSSHIPYRDSKLTRMLKDSLGGNTKTVLITCITLNRNQSDETIHSLNYAARAKKIKLLVVANQEKETAVSVLV